MVKKSDNRTDKLNEVDKTVELVNIDELGVQEDGYERLWTPHRIGYVRGSVNQPISSDKKDCPFCKALLKSDEDSLIVYRGKTCFIIMNLFPYNNGHIMVLPKRHTPYYMDLTEGELAEFTNLTRQAIKIINQVLHPDGLNLGMNQGRVAGAGVSAHLHQHILPRWVGDANFLPLIAQTRTLAQLLPDIRQKLAKAWSNGKK
ncbi:MAG: HIT domain-containing protein [Bifidobacteriaceae bacterium]|jgi:ATP adenylyltransferase|nr:HIT domain-containing protein [Bifidobacteriaceae bacterium]